MATTRSTKMPGVTMDSGSSEPGSRIGTRRGRSVVPMTKPPVIGRTREEMAQRLAQDIPDGSYVNLGIGIPELVARFVPEGRSLIYHTENGMLGMGPSPRPGEGAPELINAGSPA